jgi:hypothetical protein
MGAADAARLHGANKAGEYDARALHEPLNHARRICVVRFPIGRTSRPTEQHRGTAPELFIQELAMLIGKLRVGADSERQ